MKSSFIATAVLAFAALGSVNAFANTQEIGDFAAPNSSVLSANALTRAAVQTDYLSARSAGSLAASYEGAIAPVAKTNSNVSRDQVRIEAVMAARDHTPNDTM